MNNGEIPIEHDIPLPSTFVKSTPLGRALNKMKVGDSIVIALKDRPTAISSARYRQIKITTRTIGENTIRIWRIK
jgi:hypothetical protein